MTKTSTDLITGTVKFFNPSKGYGFITNKETGKDIFFHSTGTLDRVVDSDEVTYEVEVGDRGPKAVKVARIKKAE